jgi:hypothetical protein
VPTGHDHNLHEKRLSKTHSRSRDYCLKIITSSLINL